MQLSQWLVHVVAVFAVLAPRAAANPSLAPNKDAVEVKEVEAPKGLVDADTAYLDPNRESTVEPWQNTLVDVMENEYPEHLWDSEGQRRPWKQVYLLGHLMIVFFVAAEVFLRFSTVPTDKSLWGRFRQADEAHRDQVRVGLPLYGWLFAVGLLVSGAKDLSRMGSEARSYLMHAFPMLERGQMKWGGLLLISSLIAVSIFKFGAEDTAFLLFLAAAAAGAILSGAWLYMQRPRYQKAAESRIKEQVEEVREAILGYEKEKPTEGDREDENTIGGGEATEDEEKENEP